VRKADITTICEPIVWKMWEPRRLKTVWASTGPYRYSFIFLSLLLLRNIQHGRSQYPRSLRHELSSLSRTLGSWVRIPLKAWMFCVCMRIFCVCVVLCLDRGLETA
jgi:hypothetical protein